MGWNPADSFKGFPRTPLEQETINRMDGIFNTNINGTAGTIFPVGPAPDQEDISDED